MSVLVIIVAAKQAGETKIRLMVKYSSAEKMEKQNEGIRNEEARAFTCFLAC